MISLSVRLPGERRALLLVEIDADHLRPGSPANEGAGSARLPSLRFEKSSDIDAWTARMLRTITMIEPACFSALFAFQPVLAATISQWEVINNYFCDFLRMQRDIISVIWWFHIKSTRALASRIYP